MSAVLRDAAGCLTPAGVRALAGAPPGRAPQELAAHVAACTRCQDRMLAGLRTPADPRRPRRRQPPSPWRALVVVGAILTLALLALALGRWLTRS